MKKKKIFWIFIIMVGIISLVYGINYIFFSPTKINSFIASKIYKAPANKAFKDDNFYKCVVDAYNSKNKANVPYTTNLSDEQLKTITELECSTKKITNADGLEKLTNLTSLDVRSNQLTELDVSKNTALKELDVSYNQLTKLDVSNNTVLTELYVNADILSDFVHSSNELTELDVSNNIALTKLSACNNKLTELDVSNNIALTELEVSSNQLTELDVSNNTALEILLVEYNELTELDVSNNIALEILSVGGNELTELDVSNNIALEILSVGGNELTALDVSNNMALTRLSAYENKLTELDVSNNIALKELEVSSNQLTELDVSNNTALKELEVSSNHLTELDVSKNTALTELDVSLNQLTELDVSNNTALEILSVGGNELTELDVSNNTALIDLYVSSNHLTELDVSNNTALTGLEVSSNQLTELDVSNNMALIDLYVSSNQLTELDVSNNAALKSLFVEYNELTELDVSNNTALEFLVAYGNLFPENIGIYKDEVFDETVINVSSVKLPEGKSPKLLAIRQNGKNIDKIDTTKAGSYQYDLLISNYDFYVKLNLYVVEVTSNKYYIDNEKEYIYTKTDTDKDIILNNISLNYGDAFIEDNKLFIKYDGKIIKEFSIVNVSSDKYDLSKDYIYTGMDEFNLEDINVRNGQKSLINDKLLVKYNDDILQEFLMLSVKFGVLQVKGKSIVISDDISYDELINNITLSDGLVYKIFNGKDVITSGNISKGMILNIYYKDEVIDVYEFTDEYLDLSLLDVDDEKYLIKNLVAETTVGDFKKKISTSGTITVVDINNNVLDDDKLVTSGSVVKIKLSKKTYEYTLSVNGDVNGDGKVTAADVSKMYRFVKKKISISEECYLLAGDVNDDGKISTADVSKVYRFVKKRINSLD